MGKNKVKGEKTNVEGTHRGRSKGKNKNREVMITEADLHILQPTIREQHHKGKTSV